MNIALNLPKAKGKTYVGFVPMYNFIGVYTQICPSNVWLSEVNALIKWMWKKTSRELAL